MSYLSSLCQLQKKGLPLNFEADHPNESEEAITSNIITAAVLNAL